MAKVAAAALAFSYLDARYSVVEDLRKAILLASTKRALEKNGKNDRNSIYYLFEDQAAKRGDAECYQCDGVSYSWREVEDQSRRVAHYLLSLGLKRGDSISLFMTNKPAFCIIWIACLSIDVVPAFVNYALVGQGLTHCIAAVKSRLVLYDADLSQPIADVASSIPSGTLLVKWVDRFCKSSTSEKGGEVNVPNSHTLDATTLARMDNSRIGHEYRTGLKYGSPAMCIFTSGTTGLPKAAVCTHSRVGLATRTWTQYHKFDTKSRIYTPMPLYHSTAAILAINVAWYSGATVIIGRKFSATKYWDEVRASNANVIQYVGEVLRYLLAVPPSSYDKNHNVRMAYGNGCRPDVWTKFRNRFGVPTIAEFFAASESNASLFNINHNDMGAGAVGKYGALARWKVGKEHVIVRLDPDTEEPARDKDGFCIKADKGEPGELIMFIEKGSAFNDFAGYHGNAEATEKKILRNVFNKGDMFFRTGDLLSVSKDGYFYFHDRMGDTFRWRGENVATTQVAEALGAVVEEANVYGVQLPLHEGRAGCAAIPATSPIDLNKLAKHAAKVLPKYAQPLFIRIVPKMESTGTGKQLKTNFRKEGVDPSLVRDPVYWLQGGKYVPFRRQDWETIKAGKVKL